VWLSAVISTLSFGATAKWALTSVSAARISRGEVIIAYSAATAFGAPPGPNTRSTLCLM